LTRCSVTFDPVTCVIDMSVGRRLINLSQSSSDAAMKSTTVNIGSALFYAVTTYVSQKTKFYPPTRQFFSFCIEMLGQVGSSVSRYSCFHLYVRR